MFWLFFLIRPDGGAHSRSSSSSSPSRFWLYRACLAGPRLGGSPAPSGSRHGTPGCRSGRGRGHRPSTPRTHRTSLRLAAEAEKLRRKLRVKNMLGCAKGWEIRGGDQEAGFSSRAASSGSFLQQSPSQSSAKFSVQYKCSKGRLKARQEKVNKLFLLIYKLTTVSVSFWQLEPD